MFASGSSPPLFFLGPLLLGLIVWLVVAITVTQKGDDVDRPNRMPQIYGYTVCLISLIIALVCLSSILNAWFDRANPLQSDSPFGASLTSFESYKATHRREQQVFDRTEAAKSDTLSDATLRTRYDALVRDRVAATGYRTAKSLTIGIIFFFISLALFVTHWRWVRRQGAANGA